MKKILLIIWFILINHITLPNKDANHKKEGALYLYGSILFPIIYTIKRKEDLKNLILGTRKKKSFLLIEFPIVFALSSVCLQHGVYLLTQKEKKSPISDNNNKINNALPSFFRLFSSNHFTENYQK